MEENNEKMEELIQNNMISADLNNQEENDIKRYIYVSPEKRPEIEVLCQEKKIFLSMSFINTFECNRLFSDGLQNLNGITYLILDLKAIVNPQRSASDIYHQLELARKMYDKMRIIILAEGYKAGDTLLGRIFDLGIYNIITASNDIEFDKELNLALSPEGMNFSYASKYKVNSIINIGTGSTTVEKQFVKAKQNVTIGVVSTERHMRSYYFSNQYNKIY